MQDLKRVGADVKKVYVHKDGKTDLIIHSKKMNIQQKATNFFLEEQKIKLDERMPQVLSNTKKNLLISSTKI